MNKVVLIGRTTEDCTLRETPDGKAVCQVSVAVNRIGNEETDFFNVVVWGNQAKNCAKYVKKGYRIGIDGRVQNRTYKAKDGTKRYVTEIIAENVEFLQDKQFDDAPKQTRPRNEVVEGIQEKINVKMEETDEDLPF